jgi:Raf kinase inhibitor-like YbhB/YbcL family protein
MHRSYVVVALGMAALAPQARAQQPAKTAAAFVLTSPNVASGTRIPDAYAFNGMGCTGKNTSPALAWKNAPAGTKSFAVTIYDPDAPTGSGWWHWVLYNIPASTTSLAAGAGDPKGTAAPAGSVQGNTDFGAPGYGGPCPPAGDKPHRYVFTVYALKVPKLDLPANATAAYVGFNIHGSVLGAATFTAFYGR